MKRSEFLADLFYFARDKKIDIALARPFLADITQSDIDLIVEAKNIPLIDAFIAQNAALKKTSRFLRTDGETIYVYGIEHGHALAINIDLITSLTFKGISYLNIKHVLQRAQTDDKGIKTLDDIDQAVMLLMTHGVKHKGALKQRYIDVIQVALKQNPVAFPQMLVNLFGIKAALDVIEAFATNDLTKGFWRHMARAYISQSWHSRGVLNVADRFCYNILRLFIVLSAPRINVAVFGIDGAGKTTLINYLEKTLNQTVTTIRRPHFLPSWPWQDEANSAMVLAMPQGKPRRSAFTSYIKLIYLLFRYWLAYSWPRLGSTLYIYDRSLPDIMVDPLRYRFGGSMKILQLACRLAPPVTASILVDVDSETAQKRKTEVTPAESKRQAEAYHQLITVLSNAVIVKGEMPIDRMTAIATSHITQALSRYTGG